MADYLLIESRDPFESAEVGGYYALAADLKASGRGVSVFLVQNGVFPARAGAEAGPLRDLVAAGVEVLADDFSLRERGIAADALADGITAAPLDVVVDRLAAGHKALWH